MNASRTRPPRRTSLAERLRRHPVATGITISLIALALATIAFSSSNGVPFLPAYVVRTTLPAGAPNIVVGTNVRVAGLYAGTVASVTATADQRQLIQLALRLSPIGRDARLTIRSQTVAGAYIAIERGDYRHDALPSGAAIPTAQDRYLEPITAAIAGFRRSTLRDLSSSTQLAGAGVVGRGLELNEALDGVGVTARDLVSLLRAAAPADDLTQLTNEAGLTAQAFQGRSPQDAGRLTTAAATLFGTISDPTARLGLLIGELPGFEQSALTNLPQIDPLLTQTATLARRLKPAVTALRIALPQLTKLLATGPILTATVPPLATAGTSALRALAPALQALSPVAALLADALPPLGTIGSYLSRFPQEIQDGMAAYYLVDLYHADGGKGAGYPAGPIIPVLTCASGYNPNPTPGSVFTDHTDGSCK